jgi:uncharacterized protein involved in outer membrane biogenesis
MTFLRFITWAVGLLFALLLAAALLIALLGWNWLRGPIERTVLAKTGRALVIQGDLTLKFGWPLPHVRAEKVTFANPPWAKQAQMVSTEAVQIRINLSELLRKKIVLPEVRLDNPVVFLEQGTDGRKNWLLDLQQQNNNAQVYIGRLTLDQGKLGYDDALHKTSLRANVATATGDAMGSDLSFSVLGQYKGIAVKAQGSGGPVLALRDQNLPYPVKISATLGQTVVAANGTITGLITASALDMRMNLRGASMDQLYPLLGIAFPVTRAYATEGHLVREGTVWQYDKFSGRVGDSDIAGSLQVDTGSQKPTLTAELTSNLLDLEDLATMIGSAPEPTAKKVAGVAVTQAPPPSDRVLPEIPFKADRWNSVNAKVSLRAKTIRRVKQLPIEGLTTRLSLQDSVLTLEPLNFGLAGGQINTVISLDGRINPIQARAKIKVRKVLIAKLFPESGLTKTGIGQINGDFDLAGTGNSVGRMLATANGSVAMVVAGGEISQLMMEKIGLHLWEILRLNITGDKLVKLRCAVADFDVKQGNMQASALVFDTEVTTILGTGNIDLGQERINLTLKQKTKNTSPLALRTPIYVRGSFAKPVAEIDKGPLALRAIGAVALGAINPLLAFLPLIDAGPGRDSDCGQLINEAKATTPATKKK